MINTYLKYGVDLDLATKLESLGLPKSTFEKTSNKNLTNYGLSKQEISCIKSLITRVPIDEDIIQLLLENSSFMCCMCQGKKSDSYIIHHIEYYSKSQDNSYNNLAVLCLNDHEIAHKEGIALTMKHTPQQIRKAKASWEKIVREQKVLKASVSGDINEVDFLNVPRIIEVCNEIFGKIPQTQYSQRLINEDLINADGFLNISFIKTKVSNPATPLIFFGPWGSTMLNFHYSDVFKMILQKLDFKDLDTLMNKRSIKAGILGEYCFYVGGIYTITAPSPITTSSEMIKFHIKGNHSLLIG